MKISPAAIAITIAVFIGTLSGCGLFNPGTDIPSVDDVKIASKNAEGAKKTSADSSTSTVSNKGTDQAYEKSPAHEWMILRHAVGKVRIGDTKEIIYGKYAKDQLKFLAPDGVDRKTAAIEVWRGGSAAIVAEFDNGKTPKVWRIRVFDFRLKTSEQIHVSSKISALTEAYDDLELHTNANKAFLVTRSAAMSFVLDDKNLSSKWFQNPKIETIPSDTEVTEILVL